MMRTALRTPRSTDAFETAEVAAEAVRSLCHTTGYHGDASDAYWPSDLSAIVGELASLARRLPQAIDQLGSLLLTLHADGRVGHDEGVDVDADLIATILAPLAEAGDGAAALGRHLDRAHSGLAHLTYRDDEHEATPT